LFTGLCSCIQYLEILTGCDSEVSNESYRPSGETFGSETIVVSFNTNGFFKANMVESYLGEVYKLCNVSIEACCSDSLFFSLKLKSFSINTTLLSFLLLSGLIFGVMGFLIISLASVFGTLFA